MKKRQPADDLADFPRQVGRYELLTELGRGSMGRVFVAYDPNIERRVAIKILQPSFQVDHADEADFQRRFVIEARAAGRLSHPGIVAIYDAAIDPTSGLAYIAMELIEGASVARLVERHRPLP
ncbi:MAG: protein kinase, partial [Thermoanaerobaculia bacterium]|nr:protein kinase [Thermoanaerobaculia bacterium]